MKITAESRRAKCKHSRSSATRGWATGHRAGQLGLLGLGLLGLGLLPTHAQDTLSYANWRLVQADEFRAEGDSAALGAHWRFDYPWGRNLGGAETEYYTGREVNTRAGILRLSAHRLATPITYRGRTLRYTSGMLYGRHPKAADSLRADIHGLADEGITYGLFEIRCRQPMDAGSFPAFWLFGNPDEVDIFEANPTGFSNNVHLHAHDFWRPGPVEEPDCQCFYFWPKASRFTQQFHRYALAWQPGELVFYFDGVPIRRETRFLPLGLPMALIANLAVWAWSGEATDRLDIDYIRIYRPRRPPALPFRATAAQPPRPGVLRLPRATAPEQSNPPGWQRWQLGRAAGGQLRLALRDNFNPTCLSTLPLPTSPDWQAAWVIAPRATPITVTVTVLLDWVLLDVQGHPLRAGQAQPGAWHLPTDNLGPGAYQLRLRVGAAERYQALYVLRQPAGSRPTAEWLKPLLPLPATK